MGLKERINALEADSPDSVVFQYEAAQLAAEADALMEDMAEALEDIKRNPRNWEHSEIMCCNALWKYSQYKEQTNEQ